MKARGTGRKQVQARGVLLAVIALIVIGALQAPAFAGVAQRPLHPTRHSSGGGQFRLDAHFTESYRHKGWIQSYGVMKVRNNSRRKLDITCDIFVSTGGVVIGFDSVDVFVPGRRTRAAYWGVEGGDESGIVTGTYHCYS